MITLDQLPAGHPAREFLTGATVWFSAQSDPRFSYGLYVPQGVHSAAGMPVVVVVHGSRREAQRERDEWAEFAETHRVVIVAPLFPAAITGVDDIDSYKALVADGIRFDLILLDMLDEVAARWKADTARVLLAGHSGGGQFAERMLLVHPERLRAVAISAPGRITAIDSAREWPAGTADVERRFGVRVDEDAISRVPILLTVGADDTDTGSIEAQEDGAQMVFGSTRVERLEWLRSNLAEHGIAAAHELVHGADHSGGLTRHRMQEFFARELA